MRQRRRSGYTLLEVILAIGIGMLLVAALYVALDVQLRYMNTGRNAIIESQMSRGLLQHVSNDIRNSLAQLSTSANWREAIPPPTSTDGSQQSQQQQQSQDESTDPIGTGQYSAGFYGTDRDLYVYVSSLPRYGADQSQGQLGFSDIRRIRYTVIQGQGLVRQEVRNPDSLSDFGSAEPSIILAPEVTDLHFRYFDAVNNTWTAQWDGSVIGPPRAVEITMTIQPFNLNNEPVTNRPAITRRMVILVPAGAALPDPSQGGSP